MSENINPESFGPETKPPAGSRLKSFLTVVVLLAVVAASFWLSFQLGKRLFTPARKLSERKIEVPIPEPPPSIKALQRLQAVMSKEAAVPGPGEKVAGKKVPCAKGLFKVQAGWFIKKENAERLVSNLKAKGFDAFIKKVGRGWRVQVGAYYSRSHAKTQQKKLRASGFDSTLIYE